MGNGGLGFGIGGGGGNAKLSRERKHRMREQAVQKLSKAYHLDEIACSVATMQAASTLEDVAQLVLQRSPTDPEAKYVHFFHEKIPSRQLAECTSLKPLDEIIADRPNEGEPLRTRAVTKIFKEDYIGAAQDLTAALQVCRYYQGTHTADRQQLQLASDLAVAAAKAQRGGRWKEEFKLEEEDHPSSLETQLLFHRAGIYLTVACQHVDAALSPRSQKSKEDVRPDAHGHCAKDQAGVADDKPEETAAEREARRKRLEARKLVKTYAKRALRDYVAYLSHLDYTPGLPTGVTEEFIRKVNQAANGLSIPKPQNRGDMFNPDTNQTPRNGHNADALVPHTGPRSSKHRPQNGSPRGADIPRLPPPVIYSMSALFAAIPPTDLPPYPELSIDLATIPLKPQPGKAAQALLAQSDCHEALTYHPLLTDALHSLLLCHCLVQTSVRELQRHAHMVARLARICDGYPIFQAARSPSRADWMEVLRRADNWIQLQQSWEKLCASAPLPGQAAACNATPETAAQRSERLQQQAIMEALEDDRVHDEASFQAAVAARQRRQEQEARRADGRDVPKRWAQDDAKEYPISTERAQAIARWIKEAPLGGGSSSSSSSGGDGAAAKKKRMNARSAAEKNKNGSNGVASSLSHLKIGKSERDEVAA